MDTVRVAMWSGPRSLSTAMMRAWENRGDTAVVDEPLYACYLAETGLEHPMREAVLASQSRDWREVVATLTGPAPGGARIFFQKHMAHHLLPSMGRDWLDEVRSAFLVRDPRRMLASYADKRDQVTLADIGIAQLAEICERDRSAPVLLVDDLLAHPRAALEALCAALSLPFSERMLSWPPGPRASDGVWAPHWYGSVLRSTGFAPPEPEKRVVLPPALERLAEAARPHYERLLARKLLVGQAP
jgi:hypothetical protein